jgi:hypothetical protein
VRCDDFSHTACGRSAVAPFEQASYLTPKTTCVTGENLAYEADSVATPRSIMRAWPESDSHRSVRPAARRGRLTVFRFVVVSSSAGANLPVSRATVFFASRRARTDFQGRATIVARVRHPGRDRAVATKGRSLRATATVYVRRG